MKKSVFSKLVALSLVLMLAVSTAAMPALADSLTGGGTAGDPYIVTDAQSLAELAQMVNDGKNADADVRLDADVVVDGSWEPLGKNSVFPFKGTFDGNGHSITVTVDNPGLSYFGFFGCLENAEVKNLTLNGEVYCSEPYAYVGGLAARARGNVTLENCVVNMGLSSLARGNAGTGGFVGGYDKGVEYQTPSVRLALTNCINNGFIMMTGEDKSVYVGGIVGTAKNCVQLENCENNAVIYAPGVCVGGLMGQPGSTTGDCRPLISACKSDATLVGTSGKVYRLYVPAGGSGIAKDRVIDSGDNEYTGTSELDITVLLETQKYPSVIAVSSSVAAGESITLIKDGETADENITVSCTQGEKDITKGYIECDGFGAKLTKLNESGKSVQETATLEFTDSNGITVRKPVTFNIQPSEDAKRKLMDSIAASYNGKSGEWVVFDMAVYEYIGFGENTTDKENYLNLSVNNLAGNVPLATDRAKAEIIFASLGKDSARLTPYGSETQYSNAEKLAQMDFGSSHYTAPWILLAEEAGRLELTDKQRNDMISLLLDAQGTNGLCYYTWGGESYDDVDTTGTALAALARFYDNDDGVKHFVDTAIEGLTAAQGTNGSYGNVNSDAMVITGLAAMGINPSSDERFVKDGGSLADALMLYANDSGNGFTTAYASGAAGEKARALATEQGFRALIILEKLKTCTAFNVYTQRTKGSENDDVVRTFDSYEASGEGKKDDDGSEETGGETGGGSGNPSETKNTAKLTVTAINENWLSKEIEIKDGITVAEFIKLAFEGTELSADGLDDGYIKSVTNGKTTLAQLDKGDNSGWLYTVNGNSPTVGMADYKLKNGDGVKLYYTVDYTKDEGSKKWGGSGSGGGSSKKDDKVSTKDETPKIEETLVIMPFSDVSDAEWYYEYVKYAYANKLMQGTSDAEFSPEEILTRSMFVTILYRLENQPSVTKNAVFTDVSDGEWYTSAVDWAVANGIVFGLSDTEFGTDEPLLREQLAAMIMRYAKYKGYDVSSGDDILSYDDYADISEYAVPAIRFAVGSKILSGKTDKTINPSDTATRAEIAAVMTRFAQSLK